MNDYAHAYTLPEFEGCTLKQRFHRNSIWRGSKRLGSVADVERHLKAIHPGRRILIRYVDTLPERAFRPAFLDINKHLWWEI